MFVFEYDESSDLPLWAQLRNRIAYLITTGHFKPGDQLPTVRALASEIAINYNTVNKAYLSLKSDGYIESTRGRGAFVCDPTEIDESLNVAEDLFRDCIEACLELGLEYEDILKGMQQSIRMMENEESESRC